MKKKYSISGIDCANCAAKIEAKMNELPDVDSVILTFATGQLLVEAENPDEVLPLLRNIAEKAEPGTTIEELKRGKKVHQHESCGCESYDHHENGSCNCEGHNHHHEHNSCNCEEHEHHHEHENCNCEEHEYHHEHENCNCGDHEHHHNHENKSHGENSDEEKDGIKSELIQIGIGIVLFGAGIALQEYGNFMSGIVCAVFVAAYLMLGGEVLLTAVKNIFRGKVFDENFLMSIATVGAFFIGEYPEAVGVMLFYRIGELFEDIAVGRSRKQIMEAVDLRPEVVRLVSGDSIDEVDPEDIAVGDIIEVRPGDRIPLDGVIVKGESRIDTSAVTGEPVPVGVNVDSHVISGCVNVSGLIQIKVEKPIEESMVTRILEAVENAAASKPKIDRFISKFARIYTPFVVIAAVITAIVPSLITGNWSHWVYTALTFLVISCPCALVLSVPLAFFAGIGAGSRKGILFKGGVSLEALADIKAVVMDKTGTVTEGNFTVASVEPVEGIAEKELLAFAGCAERASTHPIAVSIMEEIQKKNVAIPEAEEVKEISGKGVKVKLSEDILLCGSGKLLEADNVDIPDTVSKEYGTEVLLALNGKYIGQIVISDTVKSDSKCAVSEMKRNGLCTAMLTGDSEDNAHVVADMAGIDMYFARQMPEDKLTNLSKIREKYGAVMFVGDGINDAPVLAGADVGAAMGSGADAAIEAADVVFMNSRLSAVPESIKIAKATKLIAMENVIGALAIKALVMILGFAGIASMWMAVFADSGVAMLCVFNSIRILFSKKA
ncbi:MAG: cadmium-translocating P-type ATPase [Lachnospiraceae bacterium]|nr:cadmium-translocating P-type ATPase [Lachnospiraceae bacterium]